MPGIWMVISICPESAKIWLLTPHRTRSPSFKWSQITSRRNMVGRAGLSLTLCSNPAPTRCMETFMNSCKTVTLTLVTHSPRSAPRARSSLRHKSAITTSEEQLEGRFIFLTFTTAGIRPSFSFPRMPAFSTVGPNPQTGLFDRVAFGSPAPGNPYGAMGCHNAAVEAGSAAGIQTCNFSTQIPANMLNPYAMFYMQSFPLPNYNDPLSTCSMASGGAYKICQNYLAGVGSSQDSQNISLKIDEKWSDKSSFFGEWLFAPAKYNNYRVPWTGPTFPMDSVGAESSYPFSEGSTIISFGNNYVFTSTLLNEFRLSFSRQFLTTHPSLPYPNSVTDQLGVEEE